MPATPLGDRDRAVLDFERDWAGRRGGKQQAIEAAFGISPSRYYQLLGALVDDDAALAHDPLLVRRLRRRRRERLSGTGRADESAHGVTK